MSKDKQTNKKPINEGHQPLKRGYQPSVSKLDPKNPPQGGTGVTSNSGNKKQASK